MRIVGGGEWFWVATWASVLRGRLAIGRSRGRLRHKLRISIVAITIAFQRTLGAKNARYASSTSRAVESKAVLAEYGEGEVGFWLCPCVQGVGDSIGFTCGEDGEVGTLECSGIGV